MAIKTEKWQSFDGKLWDSKEQADKHEKEARELNTILAFSESEQRQLVRSVCSLPRTLALTTDREVELFSKIMQLRETASPGVYVYHESYGHYIRLPKIFLKAIIEYKANHPEECEPLPD